MNRPTTQRLGTQPGTRTGGPRVLVGRDSECRAVERLLADARVGTSGALVLVGDPGIGKTALLDYAAGRATSMAVLRARGVESESQLPFAGLLELLRPALHALDLIPAPQAEALETALALRPSGTHDRFAIGAATLSLLAAHAETAPLVVLVDDAHLLDGSTVAALLFAARRLVADPIAFIATARSAEPGAFTESDLPKLILAGLDREASAELVARQTPGVTPPAAFERLHVATQGNPLALIELADRAAAVLADPPDAPLALPDRIAHVFSQRAEHLTTETRRLLIMAAASDDGDVLVLGRAAADVGVDLAAIAAAETAGIVTVHDGRVEFRHPLARSGIYGAASDSERRDAHAALARAQADGADDSRAWHLARAAIGTSQEATTALEGAGRRALTRSAYVVAAAAFARAARHAPNERHRAQLRYEAADASWVAGLADQALDLLNEASSQSVDRALRARIEHLRGHVAIRRGELRRGHAILVDAAEHQTRDDPEHAVVMLAEAANALFYTGAGAEMRTTAERAFALASASGSRRAEFFAGIALGTAMVFVGEGDAGAALVRDAMQKQPSPETLRDDPRLLAWVAIGPLFLREAATRRTLTDRAVEVARDQGALGVLPYLLFHVARDQATTNRWSAARAGYHEAIDLARETGQRAELAVCLAGLAWLEARLGLEQECREHAAEGHTLCSELGLGLYDTWISAAYAELALAMGDADEAIVHLEAQAETLSSLGLGDVDLSPVPELVEAYLRVARRDAAAGIAGTFIDAARAKGQPWALARAERCRGLLASEADSSEAFERALELHALTGDAFEDARTRLAFGARLRRNRRRKHARQELETALRTFEDLGARPWADQAAVELRATGATARRRDPGTLNDLTPQELQIGLLLAEGRTTREAAAKLFVSPKTVEYHLRHVYQKLGIHTRKELADALGSPSRAEAFEDHSPRTVPQLSERR